MFPLKPELIVACHCADLEFAFGARIFLMALVALLWLDLCPHILLGARMWQ